MQGADFRPVNKEVEAIKKGLSANYTKIDALMNMSFSPLAAAFSPGYVVLWALPLAGLMFSGVIRLARYTTAEKQAAKRRRRARRKAVGQLKKIVSSEPQRRRELLVWAMKDYIGERFDRMAGSLTADDCHEVIAGSAVESSAAERFREIIGDCEAARYTSAETNIDRTRIREVSELIRIIEKEAKE